MLPAVKWANRLGIGGGAGTRDENFVKQRPKPRQGLPRMFNVASLPRTPSLSPVLTTSQRWRAYLYIFLN